MNRSLLVAVWLTCLLTACAGKPGFRDFDVPTTSIAYVSVKVVNDQTIVVSMEPIPIQQQDRGNTIYWSLPPGGAYFFPNTHQNPGIDFDSPKMPATDCMLDNENKYTYVCTYNRARKAKYPYTIRVTKNGTDIVKSDPTVMNN